jgi:hypothetical protein
LPLVLLAASLGQSLFAQPIENRKYKQEDKFRQLEEILPTPNDYRTASGEPGPGYWQQEANYDIDVTLNDEDQTIVGSETITYFNNSPQTLRYVWLQLDANIYSPDSDANKLQSASVPSRMSTNQFRDMMARRAFDGGVKITKVEDSRGQELKHTIVKTMMRVDLAKPLLPGEEFEFSIDWNYQINNSDIVSGRTGCEFFEEDGNWIYEIAQWFPRMVAFTDATGWQHKQFLGRGEFTLEFGDYLVRITVPEDHIVGATGVLQNPNEVLTDEQVERYEASRTASEPMFIVTPDEAAENQKEKSEGMKTWVYQATKVRDFAFASSRKFIWDAQGHSVGGNEVMAMSLYPNEGEPLWSKYSTQSIIHTLNVYSRYTFDYPYPVAYSVNGPVGGMEYPMICFNGPRPEKDGTYSDRTKYGLISVIIHEVGHNYFPMIVNSDERQWTWMDEGLNTFLQYLSEQEWEDDYPSRRGEAGAIAGYMRSSQQVPIMTNSESILQFGANGYAKPATALNVLRETILGRELFDYSFKEYARRWKFKRPNPADFFRTMEDASGVDLDWFWRGWFYTTDHVDIAITGVQVTTLDQGDPKVTEQRKRQEKKDRRPTLSEQRNEDLEKRANIYPDLKDFYNEYDPDVATEEQKDAYKKFLKDLTDEEREMLESKDRIYSFDFENRGGLVMPIILMVTFEDDSEEEIRLPAEIWRKNSERCSTSFMTEKTIVKIEVDPYRETADADRDNNFFPPQIEPSRFELYKSKKASSRSNPMSVAKKREERKRKEAEEKKKKAAEEKAKKESEKDDEKADDEKADDEKAESADDSGSDDESEMKKSEASKKKAASKKSEPDQKKRRDRKKDKKDAPKKEDPTIASLTNHASSIGE